MSQYLILIYEDEQSWATADADTSAASMAEHEAFGNKNGAALRGGAYLHPTNTATSLRRGSDGDFVVTDGPFAESKEALGGYYLVEAASLDEALEIAKQVPAPFGGVEVRPVHDLG
jgi:hypothetical protein